MYAFLLHLHSIVRWFVLASLIISLYRAYVGFQSNKIFSGLDNKLRIGTVTIAHIQLVTGVVLYIKSPAMQYFWSNISKANHWGNNAFFGLVHSAFMFFAIVLITIGSAKTKRKSIDKDKFKIIFFWFSIALLIIFLAIPWPFSPFANRPYIRTF